MSTARHFLLPTPAGAYFASAEASDDRLRSFIRLLLAQPVTPSWQDQDDGFVRRLAAIGWIQYLDDPRSVSRDGIENALLRLLPALSGKQQALLADAHGFHLASTGFAPNHAEELAARSANVTPRHNPYQRSVSQDLRMYASAWSLPAASGHARIGFWPLYVGGQRFVLVIAGTPQLNQPELVDLVWLLQQRYGLPGMPAHRHSRTTPA
jgi:hypothetical protein